VQLSDTRAFVASVSVIGAGAPSGSGNFGSDRPNATKMKSAHVTVHITDTAKINRMLKGMSARLFLNDI
jgi:hypothetical protein